VNDITGIHFVLQIARHCSVDGKTDVFTNAVLFVDHAKTHPGKLPVKISQNVVQSRTIGSDLRLAMSVGKLLSWIFV
jgi:hypothetical protein